VKSWSPGVNVLQGLLAEGTGSEEIVALGLKMFLLVV
jgi:hypothetical protein